MKKLPAYGVLILCLGIGSPAIAQTESYGASGVSQVAEAQLTLENMLNFAIQDEYLARGEYQKIMDKFGQKRPFSKIIKAEETHISLLKPLFVKYGFILPPDRGLELAVVPPTFAETLKVGVDAEIANIEMYELFLQEDLPTDVRDVFKRLLKGSESHLAAFTKSANR
ncbi:DUF2202 domain-containing protein [Psychromonas sp. RZ22]|uniref:ferritin-like domain-containing protein n=1 Tax=Psychromonas algarum TaxID=2555643 RepID=UPI00106781C7|nr:DUF2202 domain-containing protein [Psychromonas sp. RZ22]TEW54412.1 DUF2202 domain-containing protein [Psychromonas sp. RZ22]